MTLRYLSLFSGIGGDALAAERAGFELVGFVEIDPFCREVLQAHWPNVPQWEDIHTAENLPACDVLGGGFPCQPWSVAGKQKGSTDDRNLWPAVLERVRELRPRAVFLENVPGLLARRAEGYFGRILGDFSQAGYDTSWEVVSAADAGAPHLRKRLWITAYACCSRQQQGQRDVHARQPNIARCGAPVADAASSGREPRGAAGEALLRPETVERPGRCHCGFPDANSEPLGRPPVAWCERHPWSVEPAVGRVAHGVPRRVDRLRALGNALVPQVAEPLLREVREHLEGPTP